MDLNLQKVKSTHEFDDEFMVELVLSFIRETSDCMNLLEAYSREKDWQRMKGAAHKMLGSCHVFELTEMIHILESIEMYSTIQKNRELLPGQIENLKSLHDELIIELNRYVSSTSK